MEREGTLGKAVCSSISNINVRNCVIQPPHASCQYSQPESFCFCTCTHVCGEWTCSSSYHLLLIPALPVLTMSKSRLKISALLGLSFIPGHSPRTVLISPTCKDSKMQWSSWLRSKQVAPSIFWPAASDWDKKSAGNEYKPACMCFQECHISASCCACGWKKEWKCSTNALLYSFPIAS